MFVSVRISLAMTKYHDQEHLVEERGFFSLQSSDCTLLVREVGEGNPGGNMMQKMTQRPQMNSVPGLFLMACSS